MSERDLHVIQHEFRKRVGFIATAQITEVGAARSAGIIVDIEKRIHENATQPADLFLATLAASQLIERWNQLQQHVAAGSISSVKDTETLQMVQQKFSAGNLPMVEIMRLTKLSFVADPSLGANKAMEVLTELQNIYNDISLHSEPQ